MNRMWPTTHCYPSAAGVVLPVRLDRALKAGGAERRITTPGLLGGLVEPGSRIRVNTESRLQPRPSSAWERDGRTRLATILHDDARLASERADLLRVAC